MTVANFKARSSNCLEGLRKHTKDASQDSWYTDPDSNWVYPVHMAQNSLANLHTSER